MVSYQRARNSNQKEERRQAILGVTRAACADAPFAEVTMLGVARRAGLAKGTLYLYFASKEELFLALLEEELWGWFDELGGRLAYLPRPNSEKVANLLCTTLVERPLLTRLLAILHSLLEQNLDHATALRYKTRLLQRLATAGSHLERALPFLEPGDGGQLLLTLHALVVGLSQMADPPPVIAKILRDPALAPLRVDFATSLSRSLHALLRGLERRRPTKSRRS